MSCVYSECLRVFLGLQSEIGNAVVLARVSVARRRQRADSEV